MSNQTLILITTIIPAASILLSILTYSIISIIKTTRKPCRFDNLKIYDTFNIKEGMEDADFMKTSETKALCLDSRGASYEKSHEVVILDDQIVTKTC